MEIIHKTGIDSHAIHPAALASDIPRHPVSALHLGARLLRQALLGPGYWYHRWLLNRSKAWSDAQQRSFQNRKILKVFERYGRSAIRPKSEYVENQRIYNRWCLPGLTKQMRTGGTTGSPLTFYMDTLLRRQKERAYLFDIWRSAGYRPFDLRVIYRGNTGKGLITYQWFENCYIISPEILTRHNAAALASFLKRCPPFFLHVYPSSLFTFIDIIGETAFAELPVRGVLAGSEAFPPSQHEAFTRRYRLPISHWYGHSEYATLARSCNACHGFHFYPTYGHTELVETAGGFHRIVATSFNAIGTQFVRYDTSDLAKPSTKVCPEPFMRVDAIEGRQQDFFIDRAGQRRSFGPYLFGIHDEFWEKIRAIQFRQEQAGWLDVKVVPKRDADRRWLEKYLSQRFCHCDLRFSYVERIETTQQGKHRYYLSSLK